MKRLIVNADDLGLSANVNAGIARAHRDGIVTSASLMVRGAAAAKGAALARTLSVGLHVDLGEWVLRDGEWRLVDFVVDTDDAAAVREEVARQLSAFRRLTGDDPTHLDSHQHAHRSEPARSIVLEAGARLGIGVRHFGAARYSGAFYGQGRSGVPLPDAISTAALTALIRALPDGLTELCCHPAAAPERSSDYAQQRVLELDALCAPKVREAVARSGVTLTAHGA